MVDISDLTNVCPELHLHISRRNCPPPAYPTAFPYLRLLITAEKSRRCNSLATVVAGRGSRLILHAMGSVRMRELVL